LAFNAKYFAAMFKKSEHEVQKEPNEVDITVEVLIIGASHWLKVLKPKLTESMLITTT
jgi:hypothetical protein